MKRSERLEKARKGDLAKFYTPTPRNNKTNKIIKAWLRFTSFIFIKLGHWGLRGKN